jgi:hypothetical protein
MTDGAKKPGGRKCLTWLEKLFAFFQEAAFLPTSTAQRRQPPYGEVSFVSDIAERLPELPTAVFGKIEPIAISTR